MSLRPFRDLADARETVVSLSAQLRASEAARAELVKSVALEQYRANKAEHDLLLAPTTGADIRHMCAVFGQDVHDTLHKPDGKVRALRIALMAEEVKELFEAEQADDIVEIADALADITVIAFGTAAAYGINLEACLDEVYRSNMTKVVDGEVIRDDRGKILKPATYSPPNIADTIRFDETGPWGRGEGATAA